MASYLPARYSVLLCPEGRGNNSMLMPTSLSWACTAVDHVSTVVPPERAVGGRLTSGNVRLQGRELTGLSEKELRTVRGRQVAMIFQQPTRALNNAFKVGAQLAETDRKSTRLNS